jgi:hypothetical protein
VACFASRCIMRVTGSTGCRAGAAFAHLKAADRPFRHTGLAGDSGGGSGPRKRLVTLSSLFCWATFAVPLLLPLIHAAPHVTRHVPYSCFGRCCFCAPEHNAVRVAVSWLTTSGRAWIAARCFVFSCKRYRSSDRFSATRAAFTSSLMVFCLRPTFSAYADSPQTKNPRRPEGRRGSGEAEGVALPILVIHVHPQLAGKLTQPFRLVAAA